MKNYEKLQKVGFWFVILSSFAVMLWSVIENFAVLPVWKIVAVAGIAVIEVWIADLMSYPVYRKRDACRTIMTLAVTVSLLTALSSLLTCFTPIGEWGFVVMGFCGAVSVLLTMVCGDYTNKTSWLLVSLAVILMIWSVFGSIFIVFGVNDILDDIYQVLMAISLFALIFSAARAVAIRE